MQRSLKKLATYSVYAREGAAGTVANLYVQERQWVIRYVAVATSEADRPVLLSPIGIAGASWDERRLLAACGTADLLGAPQAPEGCRIPRRLEVAVNRHYGLLPYWLGMNLWGNSDRPQALRGAKIEDHVGEGDTRGEAPETKSALELLSFRVRGGNGEAWVLRDLLFDERTWQLTGMVVAQQEQRSRLLEIAEGTVGRVSWTGRTIEVRPDEELSS